VKRVVILGAGGHGAVVADILSRTGAYWPVGFLDDDPTAAGTTVLGLPVLGPTCRLDQVDHDAVIVAIGDNRSRARVFEDVRACGARLANAVHPSAVLAADVRLGEGVVISAGVIVGVGTIVADDVILNTACTLDHHSHVGAHAHVAPGVHTGGAVRIGEGALIGIGAAILPGRAVGDWAVVGAGAVVTAPVPLGATAVGVPAHVVTHHTHEETKQ
jgi:sugar O-acyltransferase (sialic acid O-acetyltransferase NeuD family)